MEGNNIQAPSRTMQVELLICGGGVAGLTALAFAAELGVHPLLVEKNGHPSPMRGDVGAVGSSFQLAQDVHIDVDELVRQMSMYSMGYTDQRLYRIWAAESGAMIDWYAGIAREYGATVSYQGGYKMEVQAGAYSKVPTSHHVFWPKGMTGGEAMLDYAVKHGADAMFNTSLVDLVVKNGCVTGALVRNEKDGELIEISAAHGVIVATGGYAGNAEMLAELQPAVMDTAAMVCVGRNIAGDGINACLRAGAVMDRVHTANVFDRCSIMPDETPATVRRPGRPLELIAQPFLRVDLNGRRFMNESAPYDYAVHRAQSLPGKCYAVVFDANYPAYTREFEMIGCSRVHPFPNGAPPDHTIEEMATKLEKLIEGGFFVKADTIEELAEKLGIPVKTFAETVSRYNGFAYKGVDEDFGKESYRLTPVDTPPFYGSRACGFVLNTLDGIQIDTSMNALDADGHPIAGLYVAGCDSGSFFAGTYPNLIPGLCAGRSMTLALRAVSFALA